MNERRESRFESCDDLVVMKFGGTSVEDSAAIQRLIGIVRARLTKQIVLVVSALSKVTDQLLEAGQVSAKGHLGEALDAARKIYVRHEELADSFLNLTAQGSFNSDLRSDFRALESVLLDLEASRNLDLKSQDDLLSFGERFSSRLITEALSAAGIKAAHVDARRCIVTDARYGQASPLWDETEQRTLRTLSPLLESDAIPVLGGFIASSAEGIPTTLGRGGSDFSATILGAVLGAARIEIWTDVDGIMTTDPKLCAEARVIEKVSYEQAEELAQFGAKVLHPATLAPAMRANIPVHVLNSRRPDAGGTEIGSRARSSDLVSAIAVKRSVSVVEIEAERSLDTELLQAIFSVFDLRLCSFDLTGISQKRMSLLVASTTDLPAIRNDLGRLAEVSWEAEKALVSLVGENIRRKPELAIQALSTMSDFEARIIWPSASDRVISFLLDDANVEESVQRLHGLFFSQAEAQGDWGGLFSAYCQSA